MGKFGKKNEINLNPLAYNIGLLGESGVGKSTIIKQVCEKLVGDEGYISLDIGKEDGHKAISGIVTESVPDWETFAEIIDDIVENKDADYPKLQVVVIDTYDQLCDLAEKEAIRLYNKKLMGTDKPKADTINSAWGGFGKGLDKAIDLMLDKLWALKSVGVSFIVVAHVKRTDITDVMTEEQYTMLTSNTTQRYFNAIKQKLDFLGMAYIDRDIVKVKTNKKDNKGNLIEKGKVSGESRVINFRDDTYSVDSKCRFANIVDKISFNADEFIKAMTDAIMAEQQYDGISVEDAKKKQAKEAKEAAKKASETSKAFKNNKVDAERNEELIEIIKSKFTSAEDDVKTRIKEIMSENGIAKFNDPEGTPTKPLEEIVALLQ